MILRTISKVKFVQRIIQRGASLPVSDDNIRSPIPGMLESNVRFQCDLSLLKSFPLGHFQVHIIIVEILIILLVEHGVIQQIDIEDGIIVMLNDY